MKYYITSDVHGFYDELNAALKNSGFYYDTALHKLVILGDLFDRGRQAIKLQSFILELIEKDDIILVRGNHEDMFEELATIDKGQAYSHHLVNGTYSTAIQLTGYDLDEALTYNEKFAEAVRETPFFTRIMPLMKPYFETSNYVFVHGWIPCIRERNGSYSYFSSWREASADEWAAAHWYNGIDAAQHSSEEKTIVCGNWHASYGHSRYEGKGPEFGEGADFSPYCGPGIIAVDACTAYSKQVNVIVIED